MKVLHIINNLGSGGAEKMLVDIAAEMQKLDVTIEVLVLSKKEDYYSEQIKSLGIPVHFGNTDKVYSFQHIFTVRKFMKKDFDLIHAHLFGSQLYTAIASKTLKKKPKLVTTEHSTSNRRRENKLFKPLDEWIYKQYNQVIAISAGTKKELNEYLPATKNKTVVIENGIKIQDYQEAKPLKRTDLVGSYKEGDILVLMVAGMRGQKDQETLIRASKLLPANYHIVFVGDGERLKTVQYYAQQYGTDKVHFLGRRSDVPSIMKTCDIFVLSSHWEGFGLVAVEAMAAGLPVVVSDVPGLKEVVGQQGRLFPAKDHTALAKQIVSGYVQHQENDELANNKSFVSSFSVTKTALKYKDVYLDKVH